MPEPPAKILVAVEEDRLRERLRYLLTDLGHQVTALKSGELALRYLDNEAFDVLLLSLSLPPYGGMRVLEVSRERHPQVGVLLLTETGSTEQALRGMDAGAYDVLTPPLGIEKLRAMLRRLLEQQKLERENLELHRRLQQRFGIHNLIGVAPDMQRIYGQILQVAGSRASVLITGESGTGKELVARAIHEASDRARGPFIPVNCGAFSESLIADELFGHVRGAFTDAVADKPGVFEQADGGTLFLDEVAELALPVQARLLRVLQDRQVQRLGSTRTVQVDLRLVTATNKDLERLVADGAFREDLFYRLRVVSMALPPLRQRLEDIPLLVDHFVRRAAAENGKTIRGVTRPVLDAMLAYGWPGNVRELENTIQSMVVLCTGDRLTEEDLPSHLARRGARPELDVRVGMRLADIEREAILKTLAFTGGHKKRAAEILGIGLRTLFRRLDEYGRLSGDGEKASSES
jgi:DNA-binding NtrC family response regulator